MFFPIFLLAGLKKIEITKNLKRVWDLKIYLWRNIMSRADLVSSMLGKNLDRLSSIEKILLEVKLVTHLYHELSDIFKSRYQDYQKLIKSNQGQEESMFGAKFMQEMLNDILSTQEYSLSGVANHTHIPEDVLSDIATGLNPNPTFDLSRKLFELHTTVRRDLYNQIMRKIAAEYLVST